MYISESKNHQTEYSLKDVTLVSISDKNLRSVIDEHKKKGYQVFVSVSLSRCTYPEYLDGRYDDVSHMDEMQTDENGNTVFYGPNIPYVVPTVSYVHFLFSKLEPLLDKADGVVLTEPYFSADAGYSKAFKREWKLEYKTDKDLCDDTVTTRYHTAKLQKIILERAIYILSTLIKTHPSSLKKNVPTKIYLETGGIISDYRASLIAPIGSITKFTFIDGFITDPTTKLHRKKVIIDGLKTDRSFETALLEYGYFGELTASTDKTLWLPQAQSFSAFRYNADDKTDFKQDLIAALMSPKIDKTTMTLSPAEDIDGSAGKALLDNDPLYAVCANALEKIRKNRFKWEGSDDNAIGIVVSDSYLFRKKYPKDENYAVFYGDDIEHSSSFYGLAMPFIDLGINVRPLPAEQICRVYDYLNDYNVLILSYEYFKPENHELHYVLNAWVRSGGVLIFVGNGNDPFNNAEEWWNTGHGSHNSPLSHLLDTLGINKVRSHPARRKNVTGEFMTQRPVTELMYDVGDGIFAYVPTNPIIVARERDYRELLTKTLLTATAKKGIKFKKKDYFSILRGEYRAVKVRADGKPYTVKGTLVDLFDGELDVDTKKVIEPGKCGFFYDIEEKKDDDMSIIAIGAKTSDVDLQLRSISFKAYAQKDAVCPCRLFFPNSCEILVNGERIKNAQRDKSGKTVFFTFQGDPDGVEIIANRIK